MADQAADANGIVIRPATIQDIAAISGLITELGYPTTVDEMTARLAVIRTRQDYAALVAAADAEVAGFIGVSVAPGFVRDTPNGQVVAMVVGAAYRRRGIGRAMLARAEAWFAARGVKRITVTSGLQRADAHGFYRAAGFVDTGLRFVRNL
jgi:GNAT superfamily N-acetyltransferase